VSSNLLDSQQIGCGDWHRAAEQELRGRPGSLPRRPPGPVPAVVGEQGSTPASSGLAARIAAVDRRHESMLAKPGEECRGVEGQHELEADPAGLALPLQALSVGPEEHVTIQ
jgi:hypothetical protein